MRGVECGAWSVDCIIILVIRFQFKNITYFFNLIQEQNEARVAYNNITRFSYFKLIDMLIHKHIIEVV